MLFRSTSFDVGRAAVVIASRAAVVSRPRCHHTLKSNWGCLSVQGCQLQGAAGWERASASARHALKLDVKVRICTRNAMDWTGTDMRKGEGSVWEGNGVERKERLRQKCTGVGLRADGVWGS